jgi:hypothetical protein
VELKLGQQKTKTWLNPEISDTQYYWRKKDLGLPWVWQACHGIVVEAETV